MTDCPDLLTFSLSSSSWHVLLLSSSSVVGKIKTTPSVLSCSYLLKVLSEAISPSAVEHEY